MAVVSVLGAGSWGTALTFLLSSNGHGAGRSLQIQVVSEKLRWSLWTRIIL